MKICFISSYFESPVHSNRAPYNEQLMAWLSKRAELEIIRPVSWIDKLRALPKGQGGFCDSSWREVPISYPTFYFLPRYGHSFSGRLYGNAITKDFDRKDFDPDIIFSSWAYPDSFGAMLLAKKLNKPLVMSVLGSDINVLPTIPTIKSRIREVLEYASAIYTPSDALSRKVVELGVSRDKVKTVYSGIDKSRFYPCDKSASSESVGLDHLKKRSLFIGNFKVAKGVIDYLHAVARVKSMGHEFEALLIGKGEDEAAMRKTIDDLQLSSTVRVVGEVDHDRLNHWINACDCLCLPSYAEGLPNVVLEALSTQTSVVATNVGGIPEAILDSERYLVAPGDISALAEKLEAALFNDSYKTEPGFQIPSYESMANVIYESVNAVIQRKQR